MEIEWNRTGVRPGYLELIMGDADVPGKMRGEGHRREVVDVEVRETRWSGSGSGMEI